MDNNDNPIPLSSDTASRDSPSLASSSPRASQSPELLNSYWQFAALVQFFLLFDLNFAKPLTTPFVQSLLLNPPESHSDHSKSIHSDLVLLYFTLLKSLGCKINPDDWKADWFWVVRKELWKRDKDVWVGVPDDIRYDELELLKKVQILHALCESQLIHPERFKPANQGETEDEQSHWRVDPLGTDHEGNIYWLFDDNRLFKETRPINPISSFQSEEDQMESIRNIKSKRIKKIKSDLMERNGDASSPGGGDEGVDDGGKENKWILLCDSIETWHQIPDLLPHEADAEFLENIMDNVVPKVIAHLQEEIREREEKERLEREELERLEKLRERSGRIRGREVELLLSSAGVAGPDASESDYSQLWSGKRITRSRINGAANKSEPKLELSSSANREQRKRIRDEKLELRELEKLKEQIDSEENAENGHDEDAEGEDDAEYNESDDKHSVSNGKSKRTKKTASDGAKKPKKYEIVDEDFDEGDDLDDANNDSDDYNDEAEEYKATKGRGRPPSTKTKQNGRGRPSKNPPAKRGRKRKLKKDDEEGEWYFDCTCGIAAFGFDDGTQQIECGQCQTWKHYECAQSSLKQTFPELEWNESDFICARCKTAEMQQNQRIKQQQQQPHTNTGHLPPVSRSVPTYPNSSVRTGGLPPIQNGYMVMNQANSNSAPMQNAISSYGNLAVANQIGNVQQPQQQQIYYTSSSGGNMNQPHILRQQHPELQISPQQQQLLQIHQQRQVQVQQQPMYSGTSPYNNQMGITYSTQQQTPTLQQHQVMITTNTNITYGQPQQHQNYLKQPQQQNLYLNTNSTMVRNHASNGNIVMGGGIGNSAGFVVNQQGGVQSHQHQQHIQGQQMQQRSGGQQYYYGQ